MDMKHILAAFVACILTFSVAQADNRIAEDEAAIVYYMPYTWVTLTVEYTQTVATTGPFMQYAERYLGTKDIVTENSTTYTLTNAYFTPQTTADVNRMYSIPMNGRDKSMCYVSLTEDGRLAGIGASLLSPCTESRSHSVTEVVNGGRDAINGVPTVMPLLEEQMMANSIAKMAEGAARQIYRIRETRLNILGGDVEHVPADGDAMRQTLAELDKQEQALTALFVGTKQTKVCQTAHYTIDPAEQEDGILFRFSQFAGPVAANDLSGEPYVLNIRCTAQQYAQKVQEEEGKKKSTVPVIFYNIPGSATLAITHSGKTIAETSLPVAQLGISVPLDLTGMRGATVHFNPTTGMIQSIEGGK